ncbi:protein ACCELERATED CELL DEATH 6 [Beta vulgaris subsp. vulgaris]|uniref:protein ACCELERATED CELL DEATH 6 n=1 Tax=Beta vulgaris subsp. vulgaris TaxID=3555 RepID=UPI002547490E|nr:protein ACCELERATED CELL DEATH 6 [Beta vulgaris subsp. vulgaris]
MDSDSSRGPDGITSALFAYFDYRRIFCVSNNGRLLLKREPKLIEQISRDGFSVFHSWAKEGKLWPLFERLLRSTDVIPDVRRIFVDLICATSVKEGYNPLHVLAGTTGSDLDAVLIAKLFIDAYKQAASAQALSMSADACPWLVQDKQGGTPLSEAIKHGHQNLAIYILVEDNNALLMCPTNVLCLAIEERCHEVVDLIMEIVDKQQWTQLLTNALHLAPLCKNSVNCLNAEYFLEWVLKQHPESLEAVDDEGITVLHSWVKTGEIWPFKYILESTEIDQKWKSHFIKLISYLDYKDQNNPLHVAATARHEATDEIVKFLIEAYREEYPSWRSVAEHSLPWLEKNKAKEGALNLAIRNQHENLALYILSLYNGHLHALLDYYEPEQKILFLAIEKQCNQVAEVISNRLDRGDWNKYLIDSSDGRNILHLAPNCTDKDFAIWLVKEASEFITESDKSKIKTPLDEASDVGAAWIIQAMLKNDPSAFTKAPLAWVKACKKGHISTIRAFIDNFPGYFKDHCIKHKDSPLHHIQSLSNLTEYEEFLKIPRMKDLINLRDSQGATPLHQAIRSGNIFLTEALLNMDKIMYNIRDDLYPYETARGLLEQKCKGNQEWDQMCKNIGFDPRMKTTYFERGTNLLDVRNTLSVVAALLATITFTAGFTLPGGFDQNTGEAILRKKVAFLVFLLSDTLAMCCSMLVLICLIWSMVYDSNKSLFLIDRSMMLLLIALYSTLVAFMAGVYVVISPQCLWPTIVIIVMCSLIGFSANRTLLYKILEKLIPSVNKECGDPCHLVELGKGCLYRNANSCLKCN